MALLLIMITFLTLFKTLICPYNDLDPIPLHYKIIDNGGTWKGNVIEIATN